MCGCERSSLRVEPERKRWRRIGHFTSSEIYCPFLSFAWRMRLCNCEIFTDPARLGVEWWKFHDMRTTRGEDVAVSAITAACGSDQGSPSSRSIHPAPPVITSLSGGRSRHTRTRIPRPRKEGFRFPLASLQLSGGRSSNGWFFVLKMTLVPTHCVAATRLMLCGAANFVCG